MTITCDDVLARLTSLADPARVSDLASVGVRSAKLLGLSMPEIRAMAKSLGKSHALAGELWATGIYEARLLAGMVADPARMTEGEMHEWAAAFGRRSCSWPSWPSTTRRPPTASLRTTSR